MMNHTELYSKINGEKCILKFREQGEDFTINLGYCVGYSDRFYFKSGPCIEAKEVEKVFYSTIIGMMIIVLKEIKE